MTDPEPIFEFVDSTDAGLPRDPAAAGARIRTRKLLSTRLDARAAARLYRPDPGLVESINVALCVGAPLLITGKPGTGKTQAAWYLGEYFGLTVHVYQVRSTSTADDMKFDFDAVGYLRAAQHPDPKDPRKARVDFLTHKALWLAYESPEPSVLLIDEIDKAPRDFPNDLLRELDRHEFEHPFEPRTVRCHPSAAPLTVVTSNDERRLPDAFLRRCILHHIELTPALVQRAVEARMGEFPRVEAFVDQALQRFWEIHDVEGLQKLPSTAELIVWLTVLSARAVDPAVAAEDRAAIASPELGNLPALGALIKDKEDLAKL